MKGWKLKAVGAMVAAILMFALYVWSALTPPAGPKSLTGPMTFNKAFPRDVVNS